MAEEQFTDSGKLLKMEVDYSATVDEKLPICEKLAKQGKLPAALEILMSLEKQTRTGADTHSTTKILVAIAKLCFEAGDLKTLSEHVVLLTKRRSQIKQAITKLIQECCTFVEQITDKEKKLAFIDTLRTVTAGKIYVEVERARLTYTLAQIKEADGLVEEAAAIMQELQVETFGSMDKREKVNLILEQMRLCLAKKDFIRTQIISKKIHTKYFDDEAVQDLKLKYYELMICLDQNDGNYLNICKHWRAILNTKCIKEDPVKKLEALRNVVVYAVLSPYDNEQADLVHRILEEKSLDDITEYKSLLKEFSNQELIFWSALTTRYEKVLRDGVPPYSPATGVLTRNEPGNKRWSDLKSRVVEHNIRIMAKYYEKITLKRMSQLLDLPIGETEEVLSSLVVNGTVWAKVDRLEGVVNFKAYKDPSDVLNEWSHDMTSLMNLVGQINHLINKEEMMFSTFSSANAPAASSSKA